MNYAECAENFGREKKRWTSRLLGLRGRKSDVEWSCCFLREGFRGSQVGKCYMGCWMEMDQGRTEEEAGKRGLRRLEARWMGNEKRAEVGEVI